MHAARWFLTRSIVGLAAVTFVTIAFTNPLYAQGATGTVAGLVTDTAGKPVSDALVHVVGTKLGTQTGVDGAFSIADVPAGPHRLAVTTQTGYFPDTSNVTVTAGQKTDVVVRLSFGAKIQQLGPLVVTAARMGQTEAAALEQQQKATNIIN